MFVSGTSPLQGVTPVCHDCLVVNGTIKLIINNLHGTAARVLTSGHPPETITRVLTYGHSPGSLKQPTSPNMSVIVVDHGVGLMIQKCMSGLKTSGIFSGQSPFMYYFGKFGDVFPAAIPAVKQDREF